MRVDEKHFEIVVPIFSIPSESSGCCFHLFQLRLSNIGKLAEFIMYKCSLVITEVVCCNIFLSFCNGGKTKLA